MKFSCQSNVLQKSISIVEKAVSTRSTIPVLENMYFELKNKQLILRGNDLEIGIEHGIQVDQSELDGSVLIKAKTISSIISKIPNQQLEVKADQTKMTLKGENIDFDILCLDSGEYPIFPNIETGQSFQITISDLTELIKHTLFSASFDETKQFLNGIFVKMEEGTLYFVATDGYRLALKQLKQETFNHQFAVIIPYKAMSELQKVIQQLDPTKSVNITISERQVSFSVDQFLLISRVIEGKFPDYKQVLPKQINNSIKLSRKALLEACERASIISSISNNVVRFNFEGAKIVIKAQAPAMGEFQEEIKVERIEGQDDLKIAFNVRLVVDALKNMESDDLKISLNDALSPCLYEPVSGGDYTYVIMPIRTNDFQQTPQ